MNTSVTLLVLLVNYERQWNDYSQYEVVDGDHNNVNDRNNGDDGYDDDNVENHSIHHLINAYSSS